MSIFYPHSFRSYSASFVKLPATVSPYTMSTQVFLKASGGTNLMVVVVVMMMILLLLLLLLIIIIIIIIIIICWVTLQKFMYCLLTASFKQCITFVLIVSYTLLTNYYSQFPYYLPYISFNFNRCSSLHICVLCEFNQ